MLNLNYEPRPVVETEGMPNSEWLKYRTTGIGGSDVAAIYEVSGWTTKRALYYAKIGLDKTDSNPYTLDFGHAVEPFVAAWFQKSVDDHGKYYSWLESRFDCEIDTFIIYKDTMMYQHPLFPFMQANLDYRFKLIAKDGREFNGIFECKTTSFHIGEEKWNDNKVPYEYELQTRHYMSVMNLDYTIIACLWGNNENDYRARLIKRDLDLEEDMIEMEEDFWENNVKARVEPPLSHEHASQELDAFNSFSIADRIKRGELTEIKTDKKKLSEASRKYDKTKEKIDVLKAKIDELSNELDLAKTEILECISPLSNDDGNFEGVIESTPTISFIIKNKLSKRKGVDSDRLKEELPDVFQKYIKESSSMRFSVKKIMK